MSGDLVERLRWECGQCPACDQVKRAAADRIEALEAERATLTEIVRRLVDDWSVIRDLSGDVWAHPTGTEEPMSDDERRVLDRIEGGETDG